MDAELPFRIVLRPEPEGGYTVIVPTLQGCITHGENVEDALKMAEDAIRAYIASMKKHGEDIIDDSKTLESVFCTRQDLPRRIR
jgi:predicted RNase H-like HicB family nuclease